MDGKVVIVTGSNVGIGYETSLDLAKRNSDPCWLFLPEGIRMSENRKDEKKVVQFFCFVKTRPSLWPAETDNSVSKQWTK